MPTFGEITAMIFAVGTLVNGIVGFLTYFQSRKNGVILDVVHNATNSMKDALVESTSKSITR